ncbi:hypothetical protein ACH4F6_32775 [Streptomyces sp. NPDC017936]|uniref:hypothetical protein n=1 Tax=Streptomyces sp. NPDC017936 TaxID=3365016 RepID=UPI0037B6B7DF
MTPPEASVWADKCFSSRISPPHVVSHHSDDDLASFTQPSEATLPLQYVPAEKRPSAAV